MPVREMLINRGKKPVSPGSTLPRMVRIPIYVGLSLISCAARGASATRGGYRPANGEGAIRRTR